MCFQKRDPAERSTIAAFVLMIPGSPTATLFPYTTLFRSVGTRTALAHGFPWDVWLVNADGSGLRQVPDVQNDDPSVARSEEHTSELQSLTNLVCRLLLEKKTIPRSFGVVLVITTQTRIRH